MQTSKAIIKGENPHPVGPIGLIALMLGMIMDSVLLLALGATCIAWWLTNKHKPNLLRRHGENTRDETIDLGRVEIPLSECSMGAPNFSYFRYGLPRVTQMVTSRDPETGAVGQYLLITRSDGRTLLHPIIEN